MLMHTHLDGVQASMTLLCLHPFPASELEIEKQACLARIAHALQAGGLMGDMRAHTHTHRLPIMYDMAQTRIDEIKVQQQQFLDVDVPINPDVKVTNEFPGIVKVRFILHYIILFASCVAQALCVVKEDKKVFGGVWNYAMGILKLI